MIVPQLCVCARLCPVCVCVCVPQTGCPTWKTLILLLQKCGARPVKRECQVCGAALERQPLVLSSLLGFHDANVCFSYFWHSCCDTFVPPPPLPSSPAPLPRVASVGHYPVFCAHYCPLLLPLLVAHPWYAQTLWTASSSGRRSHPWAFPKATPIDCSPLSTARARGRWTTEPSLRLCGCCAGRMRSPL